MRRYVILSNRKRVVIALVHTVAFLVLAVYTGTPPFDREFRTWSRHCRIAVGSLALAAKGID
jgi:hypothetical protein